MAQWLRDVPGLRARTAHEGLIATPARRGFSCAMPAQQSALFV